MDLDNSILDSEAPVITEDDRSWAMFTHLAALGGIIIPFGNVIGPLLVWLSRRKESEFADTHGKESINFQITYTLISIVIAVVLMFLFIGALASSAAIGESETDAAMAGLGGVIFMGVALGLIWLASLVLLIMGAVKANKGEYFRYPFTIRMIK